MTGSGLLLGVDTSTNASVVVAGRDGVLAVSRRSVRHRHGAHVLEQIDEVLASSGCSLDDVVLLAVGTGPGSFTGLRVGLATVKTIAYARDLPLVGVMSSDVLRRAGGVSQATVVLPAGARDHYLARPGEDPLLVAPGELQTLTGAVPVMAIDMEPEALGDEAARLGSLAAERMPAALLALAQARSAAAETDDVAELTPAYVALPRGVGRAAEELGWSPDLR